MRRDSSRARPTRRAVLAAMSESLERRMLLSTVAYYRFEELPADEPFPAPPIPGGPGSGFALDQAGGEDALRTYSNESNPTYRGDVPAPTVTTTGEPNNTSLEFSPNRDLYTAQAGVLNSRGFPQFTVEASFKADVITWQNIVGKDGKPTPLLIAPIQLKIRDDTDRLQIEIIDAAGTERQVQSVQPIEIGRWYNVAAVSDGETLSLYLDDTTVPGGYVLQGTTAVSGGLFASDATWVVGRGFFNNNIADWFDGHIDEVRISDHAMDPSEFLFAQPGNPITDVFVRGSTWAGRDNDPGTTTFMENLARQGYGDGVLGYRIFGEGRTPSPLNPEDVIPWINADQIVLRYSSGPTGAGVPTPESLSVEGLNPGLSSYSVTDVSPVEGDPTAYVLTLNKPLGGGDPVTGVAPTADENGDQVTLSVPGAGAAGGNFSFEMHVLQGDTDHLDETSTTHAVLARDFAEVKKRFFKDTDDPITGDGTDYTPFHDVDGSGSILARDFAEVKKRFFQDLPAATTVAAALSLNSLATRDLFGDAAVL